jgi:hypothetical protein
MRWGGAVDSAKREVRASFFKKHNKLLSFFGASIVLLTFIVNEGIRDRLTEKADSIGNAQSAYLVSSANERVEGLLIELLNSARTQATQQSPSDDSAAAAALVNVGDAYSRSLDALNDSVASARRFLEQIPSSKTYYSQLQTISDNANQLRSNTDPYYLATIKWQAALRTMKPDAARHFSNPDSVNKLPDAYMTVLELQQSVLTLDRELLSVARDQKGVEDRRYETATWAFYLLYGLGWGLGLAANIFGGGGLAP